FFPEVSRERTDARLGFALGFPGRGVTTGSTFVERVATLMKRFVAYYRVSTRKQGESGLGLEAQQDAVRRFIAGAELIAEHQEVESGGRADRPALEAAL